MYTKYIYIYCSSVTQLCLTLCNPMDCSTPGLSVTYHLLKFAQVHVHFIVNAIQPSHPLMPSSSALNCSSISDFSSESADCIRWLQKILEFVSASISPSHEYSGLISLKIYWFDLLAVQGTLRSLLQHRSSKVSIIPCSMSFMVQLSQPYLITRKTLTIRSLSAELCLCFSYTV